MSATRNITEWSDYMAEVKWIKITTDIFDDEKIILIESLPDAYAIITVWFKLLCFAGKQNNSGVFMMNNRIAYTDKMLSTIFRMKESTVQLALKVFNDFGMIELVDGVITIPNWGKHQSLDKMEERNEYMRKYMQEYREKQKALTDVNSVNVNSKANVNSIEEDRDKDKEEDKERDTLLDLESIVNLYHTLCPKLPVIKALNDRRKKTLKSWGDMDEITEVFTKAGKSDFLNGVNDRGWTANIDWLIKPENRIKVLEGRYENRKGKNNVTTFNDYEQRTTTYDEKDFMV